jgi:transcriptional regulator of acetoin/glycerol metabolism
VRAVLAAGGGIRGMDFDLFLALASLAAAALAGRDRGSDSLPADPAAQAATTDPLDDSAAVAGDADSLIDGTLALSASELELLPGGQLSEWLATAGTLRLEDWERLLAVEALRRTGGGVPEAAALLGVSRATFYRRLDAYGLTRPGPRAAPS